MSKTVIGIIPYSNWYPSKLARQHSLQVFAQHPTGKLHEDRKIALSDFRNELGRLKRFAAFAPNLRLDLPVGTEIQLDQLKLVIGSDWVWYFDQGNPVHPIFLGDLPQWRGVRRYAYAASFGIARPEHEIYQKYAPYLHAQWAQFREISLREPTWLPEFERLQLNLPLGPVSHVLDPALLLDKPDYQAMVAQPLCADPYVLIYTLPFEHKLEDVDALLEVLEAYVQQCGIPNLKIIDISSYHILSHPHCAERIKALGLEYSFRYATDPDEFVNYVAHARMFLTPSFHGMVYSLIFGTPFSYFFLRGPDPRVITLEQLFHIAALKMSRGQSFDLTAFAAARAQCQHTFEAYIDELRRHSYQVLTSIVQD